MEANDQYWGARPKCDRMIWKIYADPASLRMALEKGEIDIAHRDIPFADTPTLIANPDIKAIEQLGWPEDRYLSLNYRHPDLKKPLVRQAIAHAVNRKLIVEQALKGNGMELYSLVAPQLFGEDAKPSFQMYEYSPEKARELLTKAGYKEGQINIKLYYEPTYFGAEEHEVAVLVKEQLGDIGINVELVPVEWTTLVTNLKKGAYDATLFIWAYDYCDPDNYLPFVLRKGSYMTHAVGYIEEAYAEREDEVEDLLIKEAGETDPIKRREYLHRLQDIIAEDVIVVPLFIYKRYIFYRTNLLNVVGGGPPYAIRFDLIDKT